MNKDYLVKVFGSCWYGYLKTYLESEHFLKLGKGIAGLRKTKIIYPESSLIFRCFQETPFMKVKVVFYFQDPYHNGSADGLAVSCSNSKISPTLQNILKEVDDNYPEWEEDITHGRLDKQDLSRWAKQGILLLNTALTVEGGNPGSHLRYWERFTKAVVEALNEKNYIIHVFFGKEAQKFSKFVTNRTHTVLTVPHPASEIYTPNAGFFGSKIFKEVNNQLELTNKEIIQW